MLIFIVITAGIIFRISGEKGAGEGRGRVMPSPISGLVYWYSEGGSEEEAARWREREGEELRNKWKGGRLG